MGSGRKDAGSPIDPASMIYMPPPPHLQQPRPLSPATSPSSSTFPYIQPGFFSPKGKQRLPPIKKKSPSEDDLTDEGDAQKLDADFQSDLRRNRPRGTLDLAGKRLIHNVSERKRRNNIKTGFQFLRERIPSQGNEKFSKIEILRKAITHIQVLQSRRVSRLMEIGQLEKELEDLRSLLHHPKETRPKIE